MIDSDDWKAILLTATDVSTVCEIYDSDAAPGDDGFDPNDAIGLYAAIDGISFMDCDYTRLVSSFGQITRTIGKEANTGSVTFSNTNRVISRFELTTGFEGLVMVIRTISRSQSDSLDKSQILFAGRCDKPSSGSKDELQVNASWILGGPEIQIPRRQFTADDQDGRTATDPEFEGFPFTPQYGTVSYDTREKRGGILGLFGFKKTVHNTLSYSSHDDLDATKYVAEVLGVSQLLLSHIAYEDVGVELHGRSAACEGEIYDIQNVRAVQSAFAIQSDWSISKGTVGASNALGTSGWPGNPSDGVTHYYSRTATVIWHTNDISDLSVDDAAPDIAAVIYGRLMTTPDPDTGLWTVTGQFSNNGAAHAWWTITDGKYFNIDDSWLEQSDFTESFDYCDGLILLKTASDLVLLVAG